MTISIGGITLDTEARQVRGATGPVALSPKAFDLLVHLIEQRPRALSKDELHEWLWPGVFVSETNLAGLIAEIRRALGDDARAPRFVRTVHRFGYAFSGTVKNADDAHSLTAHRKDCWLTRGKRRIALVEGENILGRELDPAGRDATTMSRRHARILVEGATVYLEDLGSKNGTFLRGRRLEATARLVDGDTFELGSVSLVFRSPVADESTTRTARRRPER